MNLGLRGLQPARTTNVRHRLAQSWSKVISRHLVTGLMHASHGTRLQAAAIIHLSAWLSVTVVLQSTDTPGTEWPGG